MKHSTILMLSLVGALFSAWMYIVYTVAGLDTTIQVLTVFTALLGINLALQYYRTTK